MAKKSIKNRFLNYGKYFIKEIIPVTAGILIALSIGNWSENKKDTKYVNQILTSIQSDLNETKMSIDEKIPDQKSLIDSLDFYSNNDSLTVLDIALKVNGFQTPTVKMNSWKSISNSKIELIDYKKVAILSEIEEINEVLKMKTQYLMSFVYSNINSKEKNKKQTLAILFSDILSNEKDIKRIINEFEKIE